MKKEIYVTGAGIVSALGLGKDANLRALINQQSGVQPIQFLETAHRHLPAGEVKHSNDALCEQLGLPPAGASWRAGLRKCRLRFMTKCRRWCRELQVRGLSNCCCRLVWLGRCACFVRGVSFLVLV